jgi:flagellar motor switch protein FliN
MPVERSSQSSSNRPPQYREEVLSIETTVSVTLARKKATLRQILDIVPGTMLTFDIHCDEPLILEAAQTPIAVGETVKIGDKFGLRIRHMINEDAA